MSNYNINKGIGRTVEFKGLKAQYLFIFAGGSAWYTHPSNDNVYGWCKLFHLSAAWNRRCFADCVADFLTEQKSMGNTG